MAVVGIMTTSLGTSDAASVGTSFGTSVGVPSIGSADEGASGSG